MDLADVRVGLTVTYELDAERHRSESYQPLSNLDRRARLKRSRRFLDRRLDGAELAIDRAHGHVVTEIFVEVPRVFVGRSRRRIGEHVERPRRAEQRPR